MKTVGEVITELQKYGTDMPVLVSGYEGGYEEKIEISVKAVVEHHEGYFGSHDDADYFLGDPDKKPFVAAIIDRR